MKRYNNTALVLVALTLAGAGCSSSDTDDTATDSELGGGDIVERTEVTVRSLTATFEFPESAIYDPVEQVWYVSNFGQPFDPSGSTADSPGFISKLDIDGGVLNARLVESAGDFLGLALFDGHLYASRGADLWRINTSTGAHTVVPVEGAGFLNDVAAGDDYLYVTDTGAGVVHRIDATGNAEVFASGPELAAPNGIAVNGDTVVVATLGAFPPNPETPGMIVAIDSAGQMSQLGSTMGLFDGLEVVDGAYIVTDITGPLWRIEFDGVSEQLTDLAALGLGSANDFGVDESRSMLLVADLTESKMWEVLLPR